MKQTMRVTFKYIVYGDGDPKEINIDRDVEVVDPKEEAQRAAQQFKADVSGRLASRYINRQFREDYYRVMTIDEILKERDGSERR